MYLWDAISNISLTKEPTDGNLYVMSKSSEAVSTMPPVASGALKKLGDNLAVARVRRRESQRLWAKRLGVSVPTLIRLEQGDPRVAIGVYVTALWMIGRVASVGRTCRSAA